MHPAVKYAKDYGHFHNPDIPELQNLVGVDDATLEMIRPNSHIYREIVRSIQSFDANIDSLARVMHGRSADPDGHAGPATHALISAPRCACPDFAVDGEGGWPSCDPENPDVHSIRIHLNTKHASSHWKNKLPVVMENGIRISAEIGLAVRFLVDTGDEDVEESITWGSIPGNVIGWNYLPQPDTCQQVLEGKIDNDYRADDDLSSTLCIHEWLGHGVGLPHTRGGIMNPSIIRTPLSWRDDPSYPRLKRYYGGQPLGDPEPDPSPPSEYKFLIRDPVRVIDAETGEVVQEFLFVPRTRV